MFDIADISLKPLVNYRFAAVIFAGNVPLLSDIRFQQVSGLQMSRNISEKNAKPVITDSEALHPLTLKRGVMNVTKDGAVLPGISGSPLTNLQHLEAQFWKTKALRCRILLTLMAPEGHPVRAWLIKKAYFESLQWDPLSADESKVFVESMTYKYSQIYEVSV
ncbi:hypothetical protein HG263_08320 [Pseudoalteromonas sp. JBTF-M23]|uniref:Phage tail-like protein n=1 Tax=Pseudoalteromonas caenipelagi TaxID=2726988 RepID=A0A849VBY6_9GAMM|nr:phage tail protein [Pseudoalteromonas caenipelagi]NOU50545.1 hypothetical protein [Pseudoalteromonas caenipelagi]